MDRAGGTRPARPRIVDVAALAGVSAQTVSNVINGRTGFTAETRSRVERAVEELRFQPNRYAQSLRSRRTMLLGYDSSGEELDVATPFTVSFLRALVRAGGARGHRVVVFGEPDFRTTAAAGAVDGFVLSYGGPGDPRPRILADAGVPFVALGRLAPGLPQSWVDIDDRAAMRAPVDRLVAAGHRTFGYVGFPDDARWNTERLAGTRERLAHHGLGLAPGAVVIGPPEVVAPQLGRILDASDRPTAWLTSGDALAVRVVHLATVRGLRVGCDPAVIGFDAGPLRTLLEPPLTSVRVPVDRIAATLVERLVRAIGGEVAEAGELVPTELAVGGSG